MTLAHANRLLERAERLRRYALPKMRGNIDDIAFPRACRAYFLAEAAYWRAGGDTVAAFEYLVAATLWRQREKHVESSPTGRGLREKAASA